MKLFKHDVKIAIESEVKVVQKHKHHRYCINSFLSGNYVAICQLLKVHAMPADIRCTQLNGIIFIKHMPYPWKISIIMQGVHTLHQIKCSACTNTFPELGTCNCLWLYDLLTTRARWLNLLLPCS